LGEEDKPFQTGHDSSKLREILFKAWPVFELKLCTKKGRATTVTAFEETIADHHAPK